LDPGQTQLTEERDKLEIKKGQTTHTEANLLSIKMFNDTFGVSQLDRLLPSSFSD
jgi:hypothetical protein